MLSFSSVSSQKITFASSFHEFRFKNIFKRLHSTNIVVNIIFTFSGIILTTSVIVSIRKSPQLRKRLYHFTIMVLSCFDLVSVSINHSKTLVYLIFWLIDDYDLLLNVGIYLHISNVFISWIFSLALLVMSMERYLGGFSSVAKRRLPTLLAILLILTAVMYIISRNNLVISCRVFDDLPGLISSTIYIF